MIAAFTELGVFVGVEFSVFEAMCLQWRQGGQRRDIFAGGAGPLEAGSEVWSGCAVALAQDLPGFLGPESIGEEGPEAAPFSRTVIRHGGRNGGRSGGDGRTNRR